MLTYVGDNGLTNVLFNDETDITSLSPVRMIIKIQAVIVMISNSRLENMYLP